jgi:hypothetical protein
MLKMRVLSTGSGPGTADCSTPCSGTVPRTNSRNLHTQMCHGHDMAVLHIHAVRLIKVKFPFILENLKGIESQLRGYRKREEPSKISDFCHCTCTIKVYNPCGLVCVFVASIVLLGSTHVLGRFIQAPSFTILKVLWHGIG